MQNISFHASQPGRSDSAKNDNKFEKEIDERTENVNRTGYSIANFVSGHSVTLTNCSVGHGDIDSEPGNVVTAYHGNNVLKECHIRGNIVSSNGGTKIKDSSIQKGCIIGESVKITNTHLNNTDYLKRTDNTTSGFLWKKPGVSLEDYSEEHFKQFQTAEGIETLPKVVVIANKTVEITDSNDVIGDILIRGKQKDEEFNKDEKKIEVFNSKISGTLFNP